jgi:acyl-CoA synthetase (AMP-forming)/AMP-acid ligase II
MRLTQGLCRALQVNARGIATIEGDRRRTWEQVADRVARLSAGLAALGLASGERVAVLAQNSDIFYETYFAILWSGGVIVPHGRTGRSGRPFRRDADRIEWAGA